MEITIKSNDKSVKNMIERYRFKIYDTDIVFTEWEKGYNSSIGFITIQKWKTNADLLEVPFMSDEPVLTDELKKEVVHQYTKKLKVLSTKEFTDTFKV